MIVARYLSREILKTTFAVTTVFILVGLCNDFVVQLAKAVAGELPVGLVLDVVLTSMPSLLVILLPLSFFIGIVLGYGRLFADSEMTALFALGLSWRKLVQVALLPAGILTGVLFFLQMIVVPASLTQQADVLAAAQQDGLLQMVTPGKFQYLKDDSAVLYVERLSTDKTIAENVFLAESPSGDNQPKWRVTTGRRALKWQDDANRAEYIVIEDGHRYQGNPGEKDYTLMDFAKYGFRLQPITSAENNDWAAMSTSSLWDQTEQAAEIEKLWRLTMPWTPIVVVFLALPLAVVQPRQGRYATILPAVVMILLYSNLLVLTRSWLQSQALPMTMGFWWVHLLFSTIGFGLLAWRSGWLKARGW